MWWGTGSACGGLRRQAAQQRPRGADVAALAQQLVAAVPEPAHGVAGAVPTRRSRPVRWSARSPRWRRRRRSASSAWLPCAGAAARVWRAVERASRSYRRRGADGQVVIEHGTSVGSGAVEGSRTFGAVREPDVRSVLGGGGDCRSAGAAGGGGSGSPPAVEHWLRTGASGECAGAAGRVGPEQRVAGEQRPEQERHQAQHAQRAAGGENPRVGEGAGGGGVERGHADAGEASQRLRTPVRSAAIEAAARVSAIGR